MPVPQLAEALYVAHKQRSTGWLKVEADGRESQLVVDQGNLVGADIRSGHRSLPQALLLSDLIEPSRLDALWAEGTGAGHEAIEALGLEWTRACEIQALAQIQQLSAKATTVQFEAGPVRGAFNPIPGERAVRAAWLPDGEVDAANSVFRCSDPARCEQWLLSDDERQFLRGFESFKRPLGASPAQMALLELLRREGTVERVESPAASGDEEGISWADLLDDDPPPSSAIAAENAAREAQKMGAARRRAQEELVTEMNEALRRASTPPSDDWLSAERIPQPSLVSPEVHPATLESNSNSAEVVRSVDRQVEIDRESVDPAAAEPEFLDPIIEVRVDEPADPKPVEAAAPTPALVASSSRTEQPGPVPSADEAEIWPFNEDDVADDPSDPADAARRRRQRLLRRAMENMGGLGPRPPDASAVQVPSPAPEPAPVPASESPLHTPDEMSLVTALEKKFHEVESGADHFTVLGIPRAATDDDVKAAFVELAKVFHPDRLPEPLRHLSGKMTAVFEAIREAYEMLQSESKRSLYVASIGADERTNAPKRFNPREEASEAFKRGEMLQRKRDYTGAEEEYHRAYELDPNAMYLAAEAWAIYMDPARREQAPRAKQMMADALRKDAACERAHYQLGVISRVEGDMDRAEKHFREAVRVNPKHLEANQEIRLIQMRRKKGQIR